MKKSATFFLVLAILIAGVVLISGCTKDEVPAEYYMRFKSNGVQVEYTNQLGLTAGFAQSGNQHVGTISGWNDANSNFSLLLYNLAPITENTYSGYAVSVDGTVGVLLAHKEINSGAVYSSGVTPDYDSRVTITEITETGVKGTFSGLIKSSGFPDINITEGSFYVKRVLN
ncbi:MAG: hypothetical protein JXR61_14250 [Prolixibacteraceae bacterium]|nr:hypothetical protein [Prolixibacteraceae bacterium]